MLTSSSSFWSSFEEEDAPSVDVANLSPNKEDAHPKGGGGSPRKKWDIRAGGREERIVKQLVVVVV